VDNSAYTNVIAGLTLQWAMEAADLLNITVPKQRWTQLANHIYLPFDQGRNMHLEFDTYTSELINQADVALLQYPLGLNFSTDISRNDLTFYGDHTVQNGYFTGQSAYSIAWLALGDRARAEFMYNQSFAHLSSPFLVWKECTVPDGKHMNFLTGAGGFLQNVLYGYGGVRLTRHSLNIAPQLPPNTSSIVFRHLVYRQVPFHLAIDQTHMTVQLSGSTLHTADPSCVFEAADAQLTIVADGKSYPITTLPLVLPLSAAQIVDMR